MDYYIKLFVYHSACVREYWIADPVKQVVLVYDMEQDSVSAIYSFSDVVKFNIYDDLFISFSDIADLENIYYNAS